jgi:2-polyprenyl-3-methyl-5-hydroxy-6-metoxy-1,4-benzoquinol methylase
MDGEKTPLPRGIPLRDRLDRPGPEGRSPSRPESQRMTCMLCGGESTERHLQVGAHVLDRCRSCGLISTRNFAGTESAYAGEAYFTTRNEYVGRWDEFCAHFERMVARIQRHVPSGRLLDVGAGVGAFLSVSSRHGYSARGVEVSEWASGYARREKGLDVVTGTLEDARFGDAHFDVVVLNHVIEHVPDPRALLGEVRRILGPEGLIVLGTPNAESLMARLIRARWASYRPGEHIWHFTPSTLRRLVESEGFRVVECEAKENNPVRSWSLKDDVRRLINAVSRLANRSEALLLFARKVPALSP